MQVVLALLQKITPNQIRLGALDVWHKCESLATMPTICCSRLLKSVLSGEFG
jgi:hypothetical protein